MSFLSTGQDSKQKSKVVCNVGQRLPRIVSHPRTSDHIFVGLPDKLDIRPADRLPMPSNIHDTLPLTKILSAYWTPKVNTLKPCAVLFAKAPHNTTKPIPNS